MTPQRRRLVRNAAIVVACIIAFYLVARVTSFLVGLS
jgi:hypothetical protein